ncbi:hypothetical protein F4810DRAFT_448454 [Camillea tinctor]|nr:hypothetical protein F4810DRAFT_448454 [Camillea tinctor]
MSGNNSGSVSDWVSAVSSIAAAIVGLMTLVTVYIGAIQVLSQNRMYKLGLSYESLGPWRAKVAQSTLLGFQWRISTPSVSLKSLVQNKWQPNIIFPIGFPREQECTENGDNIMAKASWVNFIQSLGLSPIDDTIYEMRGVSDLVNGIVPMRWTGPDLAGVCSILGFQSFEKDPSFTSPMNLPMQWSGPLGWIQFRSSENGCMAEFRSRINLHNQLPFIFHTYYNRWKYDLPREDYHLESRLWSSINGLYLKDGLSLYLGGADRSQFYQDQHDDEDISQDKVLDELMSVDLSDEEIQRKLFGKEQDRPAALQREFMRAREGGRPLAGKRHDEDDKDDFLNSVLRNAIKSSNKKEVFVPCPGLLSVDVYGELAHNRGLSIKDSKEYRRMYTDAKNVDHVRYPYNLGDLYMDEELLRYVKEAMLLLRPDGFYFSPTRRLCSDLSEVYEHIKGQLKQKIFAMDNDIKSGQSTPSSQVGSVTVDPNSAIPSGLNNLIVGMKLCNELQLKRKTARACFSVEDMRLFAKAAYALKEAVNTQDCPDGNGLVWAMLYCTDLSLNVRRWFEAAGSDKSAFFEAKVTCEKGIMNCKSLVDLTGGTQQENPMLDATEYTVPLLEDGKFSGQQVLAALTIVFITYFWIDNEWITDVAPYDMTMPQSVLMY